MEQLDGAGWNGVDGTVKGLFYGDGGQLVARSAVAPFVFGAVVGALAAVGAPQWSYLVGLAAAGAVGARKQTSRRARARAGARPAPALGQLLCSGGFRFLIIPVALIVVLLRGRL